MSLSANTEIITAKKSHALLKLAALASSVLLVGGYVSYRAGAFGWALKPSPAFLPGSKIKQLELNLHITEPLPSPEGGQTDAAFVPSPEPDVSQPNDTKAAPKFFPGSKTGVIDLGSEPQE